MAELFPNPTQWTDRFSATPPTAWDGAAYNYTSGMFMDYNGTVNIGDTVSFWVSWTLVTGEVVNISDGSTKLVSIVDTDVSPKFVTATIANPSLAEITVGGNVSNPCDIHLSATAPAPTTFWTDRVNTVET